jgi:hypothetical protein
MTGRGAMADDPDLNAALGVTLAWGPERMIPVRERLRSKLPHRSDAERAALVRA